MKKFAATLINAEIRFARKVEAAGLASYSQAVKAIERQEEESSKPGVRTSPAKPSTVGSWE